MRPRPDGPPPPPELTVFDGREFPTTTEWEAAFAAWHEARCEWRAAHPGADLPWGQIVGDCPFSYDGI